jgi:hypothetical protein
MCVATFLSLDAEKRAIFAVVVKTQIGHAGLANNAYLLLSFHRYKRRTALGPYWPRAYRTVSHRYALDHNATPCN